MKKQIFVATYFLALTSLLFGGDLAVLLAAMPCLLLFGQIGIRGDVWPGGPLGFPLPFITPGDANDPDGDGVYDFIQTSGNILLGLHLASPEDPRGGGSGLAYNAIAIWRDYDSDFNVIVGRANEGTVTVNAGGALRVKTTILGLTANASGTLVVAGAGSEFNTDDTQMSTHDRSAIWYGLSDEERAAKGATREEQIANTSLDDVQAGGSTVYTSLSQLTRRTPLDSGDPDTFVVPVFPEHQSQRIYPVIVGELGHGILRIDNSGRLLSGPLYLGRQEASRENTGTGRVTIRGSNSHANVNGPVVIGPGSELELINQGVLAANQGVTVLPGGQITVDHGGTILGDITIHSGATVHINRDSKLLISGSIAGGEGIVMHPGSRIQRRISHEAPLPLRSPKCGDPVVLDAAANADRVVRGGLIG